MMKTIASEQKNPDLLHTWLNLDDGRYLINHNDSQLCTKFTDKGEQSQKDRKAGNNSTSNQDGVTGAKFTPLPEKSNNNNKNK